MHLLIPLHKRANWSLGKSSTLPKAHHRGRQGWDSNGRRCPKVAAQAPALISSWGSGVAGVDICCLGLPSVPPSSAESLSLPRAQAPSCSLRLWWGHRPDPSNPRSPGWAHTGLVTVAPCPGPVGGGLLFPWSDGRKRLYP